MVFKKPTKTGSVLHDTLAYENGLKLKEELRLEIEKATNERVVFEDES